MGEGCREVWQGAAVGRDPTSELRRSHDAPGLDLVAAAAAKTALKWRIVTGPSPVIVRLLSRTFSRGAE